MMEGGIISTGNGQDTISGIGATTYATFLNSASILDTGEDNDIITGGIYSYGIIKMGKGNDSIIFRGLLVNAGGVFLGDGNDSMWHFISRLF